NNRELRQTTKASIANLSQEDKKILNTLVNEPEIKTNGQALVQAIGKPKGAKTFGDLKDAFLRAVRTNFKKNECQSVHVLFDRYNEASIKPERRLKRSHSTVPVEHKISLGRFFLKNEIASYYRLKIRKA
ncbi:hypothetical protein JTB14_026258, partial [Gonioctena quinquepunctata]